MFCYWYALDKSTKETKGTDQKFQMYFPESYMIVQYIPGKEIPMRWDSICSLNQKDLLFCCAGLVFPFYTSKLAFKPLLEVWFLSFEKILKKQVTNHLKDIILPENMGFMHTASNGKHATRHMCLLSRAKKPDFGSVIQWLKQRLPVPL